MSDCQHCGGDTAKGMHYVTDVNGQNGFYACAPAFDCHFSDILPYLQHREECRKWYERYEQQIFIGQDIDEEKPCTCGLAKLEEKYGGSK